MINPDYKAMKSIHQISVKDIKGENVNLDKYKGHVCIIINVTSKCGLAEITYKQLNQIYKEYAKEKKLRVLAFPCNQFGGTEPGTSEDIMRFAKDHGVKFDIFQKIDVNGENASPLWNFLKYKLKDGKTNVIKSNFTKFIINKNGVPIERHGAQVMPVDIVKSLEKLW